MIGRLITTVSISMFALTNGYCGDIGDTAKAVTGLTSVQGNAAVGVNSGSGDANIEALSSGGANSAANAGLAVVDTKAGTGKSVNIAVGVNTAKANIKAQSTGGGTANAGLGVISAR